MLISVLGVAILAWVLTFLNIGPAMGMPMLPIDPLALGFFTAAWTIGMVAMMFPTAVPMLLMFIHVGRSSTEEVKAGGGPTVAKASAFIGSYIGIWVATGVLFYLAAAYAFAALPVEANAFIGTGTGLGAALIVVAVYQLSPLKGECLARCHPTSFLFKSYRGSFAGSVAMGLNYAKYCVGCCWVMMAFLLVSASMGLAWMSVFALVIFAERNFTVRAWVPKLFGVGFLVAGAAFIAI